MDQEIPPQAQLMQMLFGMFVSKGLSTAAALNVADALSDGPLGFDEIAEKTGAHADSMHRLLRMLAGVGVFSESAPGVFGLNPVSELLRSGQPGSMRDMAAMICSHSHWAPWGRLEDVVRTGKSGPQHAFGTAIFDWFQAPENSQQWELFNHAMTSFSGMTAAAAIGVYDFSGFKKIVDIGGGHGLLLNSILEAAPNATGVLFDLPRVVEGAPAHDRIEAVGGDFFEDVPAGGDCYALKHIVHDWDDERSARILGHIARRMAEGARVLILDSVVPAEPGPHPSKFMDVNMLAMTEGGRERTEKEFASLAAASGLKLHKVYPTESPICVIEFVKA